MITASFTCMVNGLLLRISISAPARATIAPLSMSALTGVSRCVASLTTPSPSRNTEPGVA
ncbi:hypothetical protein D3C83_10050 [compost metagenome]